MLSITEIKQQASILKDFLNQNNAAITQSSCLQALAKMHGFKDWNTLSANLKKKIKNSEEKNFFHGDDVSVQLSKTALLTMRNHGQDGKFGEDAYRLLIVILLNLKENYLTVKGITRLSLWEKWSQERFDKALSQLVDVKFIHIAHDNGSLIITINPLHFWEGSKEKHLEAIELFNFAVASSDGNFSSEDKKFNFKIIKGSSDNIDIASIIAFAENRNGNKYYSKETPTLRFGDSIAPEDHPKLVKLQHFLQKQKPIADPRIFLSKVIEAIGDEYYVGYGGAHIHIKTLDMENEIAFITAGI